MATRYVGTALVRIYDEYGGIDSTDEHLIKLVMDMYNASCDIANDDGGMIDSLNKIWNFKHPDEEPNSSKELQTEYDVLAERMFDSSYDMLSWTHGIDLDAGYRYVLLSTPYLNEESEPNAWVFPVSRRKL